MLSLHAHPVIMRPIGKVFISPKFISISCIYVTPEGLCTNISTLYNVRLTSYLFRKTDYHVIENKTSQERTIKLVLSDFNVYDSSIFKLSHWYCQCFMRGVYLQSIRRRVPSLSEPLRYLPPLLPSFHVLHQLFRCLLTLSICVCFLQSVLA
jgi:hypothetical protein